MEKRKQCLTKKINNILCVKVEDSVLLHVEASGVIHEDIVAINPDQISFIQVKIF